MNDGSNLSHNVHILLSMIAYHFVCLLSFGLCLENHLLVTMAIEYCRDVRYYHSNLYYCYQVCKIALMCFAHYGNEPLQLAFSDGF